MNPRKGLWESLIYSQWVRSSGNNLGLQLIFEVCKVRGAVLWDWALKPSICGIWHYLQVDGVRTDWNCGYPTADCFVLWGKHLHLHLHLQGEIGYSWVQFSHSIMSNSLQTYVLQHVRLPCPLPTPGPYSKSCPLCQWCHPTISSSVSPVSSCLQSFWASGSFLVSQVFASGGQTIRVSASASVLPKNIQDWFRLG